MADVYSTHRHVNATRMTRTRCPLTTYLLSETRTRGNPNQSRSLGPVDPDHANSRGSAEISGFLSKRIAGRPSIAKPAPQMNPTT